MIGLKFRFFRPSDGTCKSLKPKTIIKMLRFWQLRKKKIKKKLCLRCSRDVPIKSSIVYRVGKYLNRAIAQHFQQKLLNGNCKTKMTTSFQSKSLFAFRFSPLILQSTKKRKKGKMFKFHIIAMPINQTINPYLYSKMIHIQTNN